MKYLFCILIILILLTPACFAFRPDRCTFREQDGVNCIDWTYELINDNVLLNVTFDYSETQYTRLNIENCVQIDLITLQDTQTFVLSCSPKESQYNCLNDEGDCLLNLRCPCVQKYGAGMRLLTEDNREAYGELTVYADKKPSYLSPAKRYYPSFGILYFILLYPPIIPVIIIIVAVLLIILISNKRKRKH